MDRKIKIGLGIGVGMMVAAAGLVLASGQIKTTRDDGGFALAGEARQGGLKLALPAAATVARSFSTRLSSVTKRRSATLGKSRTSTAPRFVPIRFLSLTP